MICEQLHQLAVDIDTLNFDVANARTHSDRNMQAVKGSLARFGQRFPIVVQKEGMIVRAGNARLKAMRELGWSQCAALIVDDSDVDAVAFAIADNRTAELAEWDGDTLRRLVSSLPDGELDDLGMTMAELEQLLIEGDGGDEETGESGDAVSELPDESITRPGDVIVMGDHRLCCGQIDTAYCDVIAQRWEKFSGLKVQRITPGDRSEQKQKT